LVLILALFAVLSMGCSGGESSPSNPDIDIPDSHSGNADLTSGDPMEPVSLIVRLNNAPDTLYVDAIESADFAYGSIGEIGDRIKDIYRDNRDNMMSQAVMDQVRPLVEEATSLRMERARYISDILHNALDPLQADASAIISEIPDTEVVYADVIINTLAVRTLRGHIAEILDLPFVREVMIDRDLVPLTDTTSQSMQLRYGWYTQALWDKGFHGEGISVMAMDTGCYYDHPAFSGVDIQNGTFPSSVGGCSPEDSSNHGTHTAGIIMSQDEQYRGMAYGIDTYYNAKMCSGGDGFQAVQEAYDWAGLGGSQNNDAQVLNFSMVFGYECDDVDGVDMISDWYDNTIDLYDVVWSLGCGNHNTGCPGSMINDKPAAGYNGVSVAGVVDQSTGDRSDDGYYSASKYGPVDSASGSEDRLKPEIMAPTMATSPSSGGGFGNFPGTSAAAPHYAGAAAALMSAGVTSSLELRALTYATAIDYTASPGAEGVDFYTGFGYVNAWEAFTHIPNTYSGTFHNVEDNATFRIPEVHDGDRVVLVYNKHLVGSQGKVSNLDIHVYETSTGDLLYQTTLQYENKEYIEFGPSDEGNDYVIAAVATSLATGVSSEPWALSANTVMSVYDQAHVYAPVLDQPMNGQSYYLGANLTFMWHAKPGTSPTAYFLNVWRDGEHLWMLPPDGANFGMATQITLPSQFIETKARDGLWEWSIGAMVNGTVYWADNFYLVKDTSPDLYTPAHHAVVTVDEVFDWTDEPGANNYVARITGILPGNTPFYLPLNSEVSEFYLSQQLYDVLNSGVDYTWAVAGTALGSTLSASDQETLSRLSYSIPQVFSK